MATLQDKFNKLYSARTKLEAELNNIYGEINNAVDKQDRKVKIERLIVKCKDSFTRVVDKKEEPFDLAQKTEDPDAACKNLEKWLETVTKKTDEFIAASRGYINSVQDKETAELYTPIHSRSGSHMSFSKQSSHRQRELKLSRLKKEELEKQHEAKLRIAKQRLEIEKEMKLREMEIERLEEDHRKQVAAAALEKIELMTKSSTDGSGTGKRIEFFTRPRAATASVYAFITTNKLWYANSTKHPKHSPTTVSSNNALRWFTVRSSIPSQVELAGTVEFSQPSVFTTFALANAPLAPNPPQARIIVPAPYPPF